MVNSADVELMYDFLDHKQQSEIRVIHPNRKNSKGQTLVVSVFCKTFDDVLSACKKYEKEGFFVVSQREVKKNYRDLVHTYRSKLASD